MWHQTTTAAFAFAALITQSIGAQAQVVPAAEGGGVRPLDLAVNTPYFPDRIPRQGSYSFLDNASRAKYETGALVLGIAALGANSWAWGSSHSFHTHSEGWFEKKSSSGGTDKFGHAFTSFAINDVLTDAMYFRGSSREDAALTGAALTLGLMTFVEVFDGYSVDHGFSKEDMVMNLSGLGFSYLRNVIPGLRDKIDFRMEYKPSGTRGFRPLSDYAGQRYLLALKLSGFDALRQTPLKYVELQGGYYARGFTAAENRPRERTTYMGIGINLGELVFGGRTPSTELYSPSQLGRTFFEHVQLPGTSYRATETVRR